MMAQLQGAFSGPSWSREAQIELVDGQKDGVNSCRTSMELISRER